MDWCIWQFQYQQRMKMDIFYQREIRENGLIRAHHMSLLND